MSIAERSLGQADVSSLFRAPGAMKIQLFSSQRHFAPYIAVRHAGWVYSVELCPHSLGPLHVERDQAATTIWWWRLNIHYYDEARARSRLDVGLRLLDITRPNDIRLPDETATAEPKVSNSASHRR